MLAAFRRQHPAGLEQARVFVAEMARLASLWEEEALAALQEAQVRLSWRLFSCSSAALQLLCGSDNRRYPGRGFPCMLPAQALHALSCMRSQGRACRVLLLACKAQG